MAENTELTPEVLFKDLAPRSFLTKAEWERAENRLDDLTKGGLQNQFSNWLELKLIDKLTSLPYWQKAKPIAIGSLSRNELTPLSDIDLVLTGEEKDNYELAKHLGSCGLKVRYRMLSNTEDWREGVEAFDILALLSGRSLTEDKSEELEQQQQIILNLNQAQKKKLLRAVSEERAERRERFDSMSNYLQPNIKYGAGGLRDADQALMIAELFQEKLSHQAEAQKAFEKIRWNKAFLLQVRQRLHLLASTELLDAAAQRELAISSGLKSPQEFMKWIQDSLREISFYADWIFERVLLNPEREKYYANYEFKKAADVFHSLTQEGNTQMQNQVRERGLKVLKSELRSDPKKIGRLLRKHLQIGGGESFYVALYRSEVLPSLFKDFERVMGLVQHDQYHRFTVAAHLVQTLREVERCFKDNKRFLKLKPYARELSRDDWSILLFTALFHDMAKGKQGDHSTMGEKLVKRVFIRMGLPLHLTVEVAWLVKNHLLLSTAAFKRNPEDPATWRLLSKQGVSGKKLIRLAIFTAIDIMGTNIEAWTDWKSDLLVQLIERMRSPRAEKYVKLVDQVKKKKLDLEKSFLEDLDLALVERLPSTQLLNDLIALNETKEDLPPKVIREDQSHLWIRFHRQKDEAGIFMKFAEALYSVGCPVREAFVQTHEKHGIYDWISVRTRKEPKVIRKQLQLVLDQNAEVESRKVRFEKISLIDEDDKGDLIISFRGKDQKGALLGATQILFELGLEIRWARVHTWGQRLEDIFCVRTDKDPDKLVRDLQMYTS